LIPTLLGNAPIYDSLREITLKMRPPEQPAGLPREQTSEP
jgi:hypothetical protein